MKSLYVLGDSISMHYGPYLDTYLRGLMAYARKSGEDEALLDLDMPQGANGGDSAMVLGYLRARAVSNPIKADLLLFNCGLHDIKTDIATGAKQVPIGRYVANLEAIVSEIRRMGPSPVWVRTTPCDGEIHNARKKDFHRFSRDVVEYNAVADGIMAAQGVPSLDLYTFTTNLGPDLYCDHVHFQEGVREKQAAFLAGALTALWA